jgi:hypothetical protein
MNAPTENVVGKNPPGSVNQVFTEGAKGAIVRTIYVEREVKCLAVFDTEVDTLSSLNTQATTFFSAAAAFFSYGVGIATSAAFTETLTAEGLVLRNVGGPSVVVVALICLALGIFAWQKRRATLAAIRAQSSSATRRPD